MKPFWICIYYWKHKFLIKKNIYDLKKTWIFKIIKYFSITNLLMYINRCQSVIWTLHVFSEKIEV